MSGYGTCRWTCGECGDSYEADGVVGDHRVDRWMRSHKEMHRLRKLSRAEREQEAYVEMLMWMDKTGAPQVEIDDVMAKLKAIARKNS